MFAWWLSAVQCIPKFRMSLVCAGTDLVAATFLGRRKDSSDSAHMRVAAAAGASHAALEDLYVVHSDGLLLRHRLQVEIFRLPMACLTPPLVGQTHLWRRIATFQHMFELTRVCACLRSCLQRLTTWPMKCWGPAMGPHPTPSSGESPLMHCGCSTANVVYPFQRLWVNKR